MRLKVGQIYAQINKIEQLLNEIELFEERQHFPEPIESPATLFRNSSYLDYWKYCFKYSAYDFQLIDSSIIQFNFKSDYSFSYLGCPYDCLTYKDFLIENEYDFRIVGEQFKSDYEIYLDQCNIREAPNMIRYDNDPGSYREGVHPASHIHVGPKNEIRICLNKILDPLSFTFLIIRQNYPDKWDSLINKGTSDLLIYDHKKRLDTILQQHFKQKDDWEFYLT